MPMFRSSQARIGACAAALLSAALLFAVPAMQAQQAPDIDSARIPFSAAFRAGRRPRER